MVHEAYGISAEVVFPPAGIDPDGRQEGVDDLCPGYFICVSRLIAYKHVDAVVQAFRDLPGERLVVVGDGPEAPRLSALASANVTFLQAVTDEQLRWLYANAKALIAASIEDFGLTPIEAAGFGIPSIALRHGGYLDTVAEGTTGLFFDAPKPDAIVGATRDLDSVPVDPLAVKAHARAFDGRAFKRRLGQLVDAAAPERRPQ
jgi:glycosyltransferase involved in cell wall biosynthesis